MGGAKAPGTASKSPLKSNSVNRKQTEAAASSCTAIWKFSKPKSAMPSTAAFPAAASRCASPSRALPASAAKPPLDSALARSYARDLRRLARDLDFARGRHPGFARPPSRRRATGPGNLPKPRSFGPPPPPPSTPRWT